jgi:hypothetical protein
MAASFHHRMKVDQRHAAGANSVFISLVRSRTDPPISVNCVGSPPIGLSRLRFWFERLELIDSTIRHQRQKQVIIPDHVRAEVFPIPDHSIVQRPAPALRASQRQSAELESI